MARRRPSTPGIDGVLLVDKPNGPTSHDIVAKIRRMAGQPRIGHGGTLDPFATGLLVLVLGRATRLASLHLGGEKRYEATFSFGGATVWAAVLKSDLQETAAQPDETEGIVDTLAQVLEADVALFFKEEGAGETRLSIRTKEEGLDATKIAALFGGGGHARAAGATIERPVNEALTLVLARVTELRAHNVAG